MLHQNTKKKKLRKHEIKMDHNSSTNKHTTNLQGKLESKDEEEQGFGEAIHALHDSQSNVK